MLVSWEDKREIKITCYFSLSNADLRRVALLVLCRGRTETRRVSLVRVGVFSFRPGKYLGIMDIPYIFVNK